MNKISKLTILGLVFVLATVFFWQALNSYIIPSKAQLASNMRIFISEQAIQCNSNPDALCLVHIFGSTDAGAGVAGVSGSVSFSDNLSLVGITQEGFCGQAAFGLDTVLKYRPTAADLSFSLATLKGDNQLQNGNKCITTVGFKQKAANNGATAKVNLADSAQWQAVGSQNLVPQADTSPITITFSATAPIPTITITPPVDQPPAGGNPPPVQNCPKRSQGDCNCDGKIIMSDWEMLRSSIRGEGQSCDLNADGFINSVDLSIWKNNNELAQ